MTRVVLLMTCQGVLLRRLDCRTAPATHRKSPITWVSTLWLHAELNWLTMSKFKIFCSSKYLAYAGSYFLYKITSTSAPVRSADRKKPAKKASTDVALRPLQFQKHSISENLRLPRLRGKHSPSQDKFRLCDRTFRM